MAPAVGMLAHSRLSGRGLPHQNNANPGPKAANAGIETEAAGAKDVHFDID